MVNRLRCAFVGSVAFSARCLEALYEIPEADIVAVLAPSAAPANSDFIDLGSVTARHGRQIRRIKRIAEEAEFLNGLALDVLFVFGLSQILPSSVLRAPRMGCIGSHPALLPQNRGRHPLIWTLANGLSRGGLSLLWLDEGVDTGDIWMQRQFDISLDDDAGSLYERIGSLAVEMLRVGVPELARGSIVRTPQDHARANVWRKRDPEDGRIDWRMSSRRIHNLVRALRPPYPGAECIIDRIAVKVWRTRIYEDSVDPRFEPGRVLQAAPSVIIKTGDGALEIVEWDLGIAPPEGGYLK